jgi:HEAT repeat protein
MRVLYLKRWLGVALALSAGFAAHGQVPDDEPAPVRRVPLAESPPANFLIQEFYAWYPCVTPSLAIGMAKGRPELARAIVASDRPARDRYAAYVCLIAGRVPGYRDLIKQGINDRAEEIRHCAIRSLPDAVPAKDLPAEYIRLLKHPSAKMHYYAAEGLARYPSKEALEPLLKLLADESVETRNRAISTLLQWGGQNAKTPLRELAAASRTAGHDASKSISQAALHSCLRRELESLLPPPYYNGVDIVVLLIDLVASQGDASSIDLLETASRDAHDSVRDAALRGIDELKKRGTK